MTDNWKEIERGDIFIFGDDNDTLIGTVKAIREGNYENKVYDIEREDKSLVTIFGTVILDSKMEKLKIGQKVKIEYIGELKTKTGRYAKNFKVSVKE